MNALLQFLLAHGGMLALGATLILLAGTFAVGLARDPEQQRRLAELSLGAVLLWLVAAFVPLPRWTLPAWSAPRPTAAQPGAAAMPAADAPQCPPTVAHGARTLDAAPDPALLAVALRAAPSLLEQRPPAAQPLSPAEFLAAAALAAAALACLWLLFGALLVVRVLLPARTAPPELLAVFHALPGARPTHRLLVSPRARSPFCVGGRRGAVVLPDRLRTSPLPALRALLAHEVAHLEAGDPWRQTLFALATPLLCLHPLFWWLRRRAHLAAEVLADDRAAVLVGKESYARTFIDLAAQGTTRRPRLLAVVPALRSQSEFFRRMTMLLERPQPLPRHTSPRRRIAELGATALLVVTCAGFLGLRPAPAQAAAPAQGSVTAQELEQLRKERDALQREIDALRADLKKLAASLQEQRKDPGAAAAWDVLLAQRQPREQAQDAEKAAATKVAQDMATAQDAERARVATSRQDYLNRLGRPQEVETRAAAANDAHVLDLLTRAIDLETEMQLQERKLAHAAEIHRQGAGPASEVAECEARLSGAKRKLILVHAAIEAERDATMQEIDLLKQRKDGGVLDADGTVRLIRAKARLHMLQSGAK